MNPLPQMNISHIDGRLWQGSAPLGARDRGIVSEQFDVLVLAAEEFQPTATEFPGMHVVHAPFRDEPITPEAMAIAMRAARIVARRLIRGDRVLVTCLAGWNRSGLISALSLREATGASGKTVADVVQSRRPNALINGSFLRTLHRLR